MAIAPTDTVWDRRRQFVVGELETVALELFAQRGFRAVTVDDIADATGVSARTLFRYFPTKEDILLGYPRRLTVEAIAMIGALELSDSPIQALWDHARQILTESPPDVARMNLWMRAAMDSPEVVDRIRGERTRLMLETVTTYCANCLGVDLAVDPRPRLLAGMYVGFELSFLEALGGPESTLPELVAAADRSITALTHLAIATT